MAVYRPTYCTRLDVKTALDVQQTADYNAQIDSALMAGADDVDELCHRRFYNVLETRYWDWPNFQRAWPWRIWLDQAELADVTVNVPVVTTGSTVIPNSAIFWGDPNYPTAPFNQLQLNRSQSYAFGVGNTPQRDVSIEGLYGYWLQTRAAGTLAAAVSSTTATTVTVSDSSPTGLNPGDVLTVDTESMLVEDNALADTGQQQTGDGCSTAEANDNILQVGTGSALNVGELIVLDSETMLVQSINGNNVTIVRSYDGTLLATHDDAEVYAWRLLTVQRGFGGTTAATHTDSASLVAALVPGQVHELALAETLNYVLQKTTGYARVIGENGAKTVPGGSLPDLRQRVYAQYGRKGRTRVV